MMNTATADMESRKQSADMLRNIAELLEDPAVEVDPVNIDIKQFVDSIAEDEKGKSIKNLTRDILIEIRTKEIVKSL
ncbi:hypothetical protein SporoP37_00390 [Sporosarcina sp. P37]|uniref:hypothetical protein n=1 Tax=unclassified Sporosarcina TaxID=2647733 RepID=UPI000A17D5DF|nr:MULTISPECIES: hypothetical protein [unclassified Sporosarcina]ARK23298.1 hypothetical protein SporoP37_00390 [Sporosarcina sp. P37]PID19550.1 hypothetical protein CSV62_03340 [Sporosarcina sp. P35]